MNVTMSALQLDQQAERSRRGQAGNIRAGKAAGSLPYGYKIRYLNDNGVFEVGLRDINPDEATVVERIYAEFIAGKSYLDIAKDLNIDRIPSPRGGILGGRDYFRATRLRQRYSSEPDLQRRYDLEQT